MRNNDNDTKRSVTSNGEKKKKRKQEEKKKKRQPASQAVLLVWTQSVKVRCWKSFYPSFQQTRTQAITPSVPVFSLRAGREFPSPAISRC